MGESGHPVPFTEIEGKRTPDCSCPIPIEESTTRVFGSSLKNARIDLVSGDDAPYYYSLKLPIGADHYRRESS